MNKEEEYGSLVLTRKEGQSVHLFNEEGLKIDIIFYKATHTSIKFLIRAPKSIQIQRDDMIKGRRAEGIEGDK